MKLDNKAEVKPFFSFLIPTRNRPDLVNSLVLSILDQDFKDFEIVICDNSSDELTQDVLFDISDSRINNIRTGNLKMADNWNRGFDYIKGKYVLLFSDKGVLKKGSLRYLYDLLESTDYKCVTWCLDTFVDPDRFIFSNSSEESKELSSEYLLKTILGADWQEFDVSPMHCTSCVSKEIIDDIKVRHTSVCQELNPDYTMAAQILLTVDKIININKNLAFLRRPSHEEGYGNGSSFVKKTGQSKDFMSDHFEWVNRTKNFSEVPIEGNNFVLDIILKDIYKVLKDNDRDPNDFLPQDKRKFNYYKFTFLEILWRTRVGVNMQKEYFLWRSSLAKEPTEIQDLVSKEKSKLLLDSLKAICIYFVKTNRITFHFLKIYRRYKYKNYGIKFLNVNECFKSDLIKIDLYEK